MIGAACWFRRACVRVKVMGFADTRLAVVDKFAVDLRTVGNVF